MNDLAHILVVDDSMANLLMLKEILNANNYKVSIQKDGNKVVDMLLKDSIDLVLLDIMMPEIDGFEVCKMIKENDIIAHIPIIFLTAKIDESSLLYGFELGGVDYIKKPFLLSELLARVQTHVDLKKTHAKLQIELKEHIKTQEHLYKSRNILRLNNLIAEIFLTTQGVETYQKLQKKLLYYFKSDICFIGILDDNNDLVSPSISVRSLDEDNRILNRKHTIKEDRWKSLFGNVIIEQKPFIDNSQFNIPVGHDIEVNNCIIVPIISDLKTIGVILVANSDSDYATEHLNQLHNAANSVAPILLSRLKSEDDERKKQQAEKELQYNEEKYRTLFNQNNDAIFTYYLIDNKPSNFIEINDSAMKMLGYSKKELLKMNPADLSVQNNLSLVQKKIDFVVENNKATFESFFKTKQGNIIPVELNSRVFKYSGKKAIMSVVRDISERKDFSKQLLNTILETEEKERSRFAKDIHDGLGAILSSINMYVNLLEKKRIEEKELPDAYKQMKELINEAASSSKEIANNLLPNLLNNIGLISSINTLCEKVSSTGVLDIDFNFNEKIDNIALEFKINIYRIVSELINNTIKHAKASFVKLDIGLENNYLILDYNDNGIGFDAEKTIRDVAEIGGQGIHNIMSRVKSMHGDLNIQSDEQDGVSYHIVVNTEKKRLENQMNA